MIFIDTKNTEKVIDGHSPAITLVVCWDFSMHVGPIFVIRKVFFSKARGLESIHLIFTIS